MEPKILCIGKGKIAVLTSADISEDTIAICPNPKPINVSEYGRIFQTSCTKRYTKTLFEEEQK